MPTKKGRLVADDNGAVGAEFGGVFAVVEVALARVSPVESAETEEGLLFDA